MRNLFIWKKWVDALRSGKYTQCYTLLENNGSYCANGVLLKELGLPFMKSISYPIAALILGLPDGQLLSNVAKLNNSGVSFKECADYIEWFMAQEKTKEVLAEVKETTRKPKEPIYA